MPFCATTVGCLLDDVVGEHIYFTRFQFDTPPASLRHLSYDVTTGSQHRATSRSYADDVRSSSRRLVVGDTWETATPTASLQHLRGGKRGSLVFHAVGTRLAALWGEANGGSPATIFDTATHQAVQLRLPPDYHPGTTSYSVFEWLDDDTIAVTPDHNLSSAEILTCRLSDGRCQVAVKKGPQRHDAPRADGRSSWVGRPPESSFVTIAAQPRDRAYSSRPSPPGGLGET